jgi:hypothetical protein
MISSIMSSDKRVIRLKKRLKETSFKVKTTRVPFSKDSIKELSIPAIVDGYNYYIRAVNEFNHLIA